MTFPRVSLVVVNATPNQECLRIVKHVFDCLAQEDSVHTILLTQAVADLMIAHAMTIESRKTHLVALLSQQLCDVDLLIVVGGDGSVLKVARMGMGTNVPIIGLNQGKLGFLAELHSAHFMDSLRAILRGDYLLEKRPVLKLQQYDADNQVVQSCDIDSNVASNVIYAVNELTVQGDAQMIVFEVTIAHQHLFRQRGDGIMIATPTGSTGHCLSAGGPIVAPDVAAMCLVPICPHNLSSRPVIIDPSSRVAIRLLSSDCHALWCADGVKLPNALHHGHSVYASLVPHAITLLHAPHYRFLAHCAEKLGWEKLNT